MKLILNPSDILVCPSRSLHKFGTALRQYNVTYPYCYNIENGCEGYCSTIYYFCKSWSMEYYP